MSVRIARLRSGEDVIADMYEVTGGPETEKDGERPPVAYQLREPYSIFMREGLSMNIGVEDDVDPNIHKISDPEVVMQQWAPFNKNSYVFLRIDEVIAAYETHDQIIEKYNSLVEARQHGERENAAPNTEE